MSKQKILTKKKITIVSNKIKFPETIHERALELLNANMIEGFLPISVKRKKQKAWMVCQVEGMLQAKKYFSNDTGKLTFLDFVAQIIERISTCNNNFINSNNMLLDLDGIFVVPATGTVKCVYWPVVNNDKYVLPKDFFKSLPSHVNFNKNQDMAFLNSYKSFFNGVQAFSLLHFEKLIMDLAGKEVEIQSFSPESKLLQTNLPQVKVIEKEHKVDKTYDIFTQLNSNQVSNKSVANNATYNGTVVLADSGSLASSCQPSLIDISGREFMIFGSPFSIGKSKDENDLHLPINTISRKHAQIRNEQGKYYLVDKGSTNHTYLNGQMLNPEEYYELTNGDEIKFARTKFTFVNEN